MLSEMFFNKWYGVLITWYAGGPPLWLQGTIFFLKFSIINQLSWSANKKMSYSCIIIVKIASLWSRVWDINYCRLLVSGLCNFAYVTKLILKIRKSKRWKLCHEISAEHIGFWYVSFIFDVIMLSMRLYPSTH